MMALLALLPATGHDQMWLLYAAHRVLEGQPLYGPTLLESNPPLMIWLLLPVVKLSTWLPVPPACLLKAATLLLGAASACWSYSLLQRQQRWIHPAMRMWLLLTFVIVFGVAPARDFAQRDHLLALLCLPYLVSIATRLRGITLSSKETMSLGLCAGLGICLKPHQALLFLAMEALLLAKKKRWWTLDAPALIAIGVLYIIAVRWLTPLYFTQALPLLRDCYWAFGHRTLLQLLEDAPQLHVLALLCLTFAWRQRRQAAPLHEEVFTLLIAGIASTCAYDLQGTGWYYQQLPAISFFSLALALQIGTLFAQNPIRWTKRVTAPWILYAGIALTVLALALTTHCMDYPFTEARALPISAPDPALLASLPAGTPIYVMTTNLDDTLPAVTRWSLTWGSRMPHMWMLPAILRAESTPQDPQTPTRLTQARIQQLDTFQHQVVTQDLMRWKPLWVFVERCYRPEVHCQVLEDRHDNLLAWFNRDATFRATFSDYEWKTVSGDFDVFQRVR